MRSPSFSWTICTKKRQCCSETEVKYVGFDRKGRLLQATSSFFMRMGNLQRPPGTAVCHLLSPQQSLYKQYAMVAVFVYVDVLGTMAMTVYYLDVSIVS
jgi:hypothetical protein